ncbi:MAG TPA: rod shape-determining protein MreC [Polyangiaceae bacterium]|nr:rod shape-determining protein MreC [Polyangiaceae bacterium]
MGPFRRYRDTALVIVLLAVPFFVLRATIRRPDQVNTVDRAILRVTAPVAYIASAFARQVSSLIGEYVYLVDVKADNDKLAYENSRLRAQVRDLAHQGEESERLKQLLGLRDELGEETVSAVVMGKDTTEYFRVAHLVLDNPGPGIATNMAVIARDGAVGIVRRVAGDKVDVTLAVDSGFGVDVVVERTGARGIVRGVGDPAHYAVRVEYVQRVDEVSNGDLLVTSGFGCHFPKGIPVARVTNVTKRDFGVYQQVDAEPTVDFSRLHEVLILTRDTKDCVPGAGAKQSGR